MAKKAILSIVMIGLLVFWPGSLLAAAPQQRIGQDIIVNGQHVAGASVVQNGIVQSFTCSNPQQYVTVDQSSSGWACFDEMTGTWLLHALPPQTANTSVPPSIDYSAPEYVAPTSSYDYYGYAYPYAYSYPYGYGYPYYGYPYWGGWGYPWGGWGWGWPTFAFGFGNGYGHYGHGYYGGRGYYGGHGGNWGRGSWGHGGSGFRGGGFNHGGGFHGGSMAHNFGGGGMRGGFGGGHGRFGGGHGGFGGGGHR